MKITSLFFLQNSSRVSAEIQPSPHAGSCRWALAVGEPAAVKSQSLHSSEPGVGKLPEIDHWDLICLIMPFKGICVSMPTTAAAAKISRSPPMYKVLRSWKEQMKEMRVSVSMIATSSRPGALCTSSCSISIEFWS